MQFITQCGFIFLFKSSLYCSIKLVLANFTNIYVRTCKLMSLPKLLIQFNVYYTDYFFNITIVRDNPYNCNVS